MQKILKVKIQIESLKKKEKKINKSIEKKGEKKRDLDEFNQNIHCSFRVDDFCRN